MSVAIKWYIVVSTITSGVIAFTIIISAILMPVLNPDAPTPKFLESWGGVIVGFYFGSFLTLLTKIVENGSDSAMRTEGDVKQ